MQISKFSKTRWFLYILIVAIVALIFQIISIYNNIAKFGFLVYPRHNYSTNPNRTVLSTGQNALSLHQNATPLSTEGDALNSTNTSTWDGRCVTMQLELAKRRMVKLAPVPWEDLEDKLLDTGILPGGRWSPTDCVPSGHVAIIVPYRNRDTHLRVFLDNMHPMFQKQRLNYGIYLVEQREGFHFNRAMLMNIGFVEMQKLEDCNCFIFHDVDLLPESELNIYNCSEKPRHLPVLIDKFHYEALYDDIFGGATALTREHMLQINGFPNSYFGWGGEDDDISKRVKALGPGFTHVPAEIGRYKMIVHGQDSGNPKNPIRSAMLNSCNRRFKTDGLNSLDGMYSVLKVDLLPLYTRIYVDIDQKAILAHPQLSEFIGYRFIQHALNMPVTFMTLAPPTSVQSSNSSQPANATSGQLAENQSTSIQQ